MPAVALGLRRSAQAYGDATAAPLNAAATTAVWRMPVAYAHPPKKGVNGT